MGKPSRESVFSRRLLFGGLWPQNKSADLRRKPLRFQDVGAAAAFYSCHRDATVFTFEFIYLKKKGGGGSRRGGNRLNVNFYAQNKKFKNNIKKSSVFLWNLK